MKVFLTGVNGYLGRSLAAYLMAQGYRIAGSSRRTVAMPGVDLIQQTLGDRVQPEIFAGCDVMIHAAHDFTPGSMARNVEGTLALRDAAAMAGVAQQIFLTSCSARAEAESEYGRTKYRIEQSFLDATSVNLRLGLVIGNGGLFARQREALLRTPVVPIVGTGDSRVAVIGISHLLDATEVVVRGQLIGSRNLFYQLRPTMKEFVQQVKKYAGQRPFLLPVGARFAASAVTVLKSMGVPIPADPGQIRALLLNQDSPWQSDLPALLPRRDQEFRLSYALEQLKNGDK